MKKVLIGIIIGCGLTVTSSVFADSIKQFILHEIDYPILVNGKEYKSPDLPVLNYEDNTYVPLRALGALLGTNVKWNDEKNRVEIGINPDENIPPEINPELQRGQPKTFLINPKFDFKKQDPLIGYDFSIKDGQIMVMDSKYSNMGNYFVLLEGLYDGFPDLAEELKSELNKMQVITYKSKPYLNYVNLLQFLRLHYKNVEVMEYGDDISYVIVTN